MAGSKRVSYDSSSGKRKREGVEQDLINDDINSIFVKTSTGETINLKVERSNTIGSVKLKIYKNTGIRTDEQVIMYNGKLLEDMYTLANLSIKNLSIFTLLCKSKGLMKICIKNTQGNKYHQFVKPSDTIANVKAMIPHYFYWDYEGPIGLIFNDVILEDSGILTDFHIKNDSILTIMVKSDRLMEIRIKTLVATTITLKVNPSDTIEYVKKEIEAKVKVPSNEQALIFNEIVLDDCGTLFDFNINKGSTLTLMRISMGKMEIFIKTPDGKTITLNVKPTDTISTVKSKIPYIRADEQVLIFNEMVLDDNGTLVDFNINKESTLILMQKSKGLWWIFVKTEWDKTLYLDVRPSDTISKINALIQDMEGFPPEQQKLIFDGKILNHGPTLSECDIHEGSTIHLCFPRGGGM